MTVEKNNNSNNLIIDWWSYLEGEFLPFVLPFFLSYSHPIFLIKDLQILSRKQLSLIISYRHLDDLVD